MKLRSAVLIVSGQHSDSMRSVCHLTPAACEQWGELRLLRKESEQPACVDENCALARACLEVCCHPKGSLARVHRVEHDARRPRGLYKVFKLRRRALCVASTDAVLQSKQPARRAAATVREDVQLLEQRVELVVKEVWSVVNAKADELGAGGCQAAPLEAKREAGCSAPAPARKVILRRSASEHPALLQLVDRLNVPHVPRALPPLGAVRFEPLVRGETLAQLAHELPAALARKLFVAERWMRAPTTWSIIGCRRIQDRVRADPCAG